MKFMLTFTLKPETKRRDDAIARFKKTGGHPLKVESDAAATLTEFALMWSDLMELRIDGADDYVQVPDSPDLSPYVTTGEITLSAWVKATQYPQGADPYTGQFRRDLRGSDLLHWGEGTLSVSPAAVALTGRLAPGPDYKLYLSPEFADTREAFFKVKGHSVRLGLVRIVLAVHQRRQVSLSL